MSAPEGDEQHFCPRCGTRFDPGQEYCLECGSRLGAKEGLIGRLGAEVEYEIVHLLEKVAA